MGVQARAYPGGDVRDASTPSAPGPPPGRRGGARATGGRRSQPARRARRALRARRVSAAGALAVLGRAYWQTGEGERATETLEEAIALLGEQASPELVQAYNWASAGHMLSGRYIEGRDLAERGLVLAGELELLGLRSHL